LQPTALVNAAYIRLVDQRDTVWQNRAQFLAVVHTRATGITAAGDVVGFYGNPPMEHGFLLSRGSFTMIDFPGASSTGAFGINARGDIVGLAFSAGVGHGFLASGDTYTEIMISGSTRTQLQGINPEGEIVGWYVSGGVTHGLLLRKGT
jgi:hypothetical protein